MQQARSGAGPASSKRGRALRSALESLREGSVLDGRYRLTRVLGSGGVGTVWLAEHLTLHAPVAVKIIRGDVSGNRDVRLRFDMEARLVVRIRSAHVVKVFDHGLTDKGAPYVVMECLAGETLRDRLAAKGRLSVAETTRIVVQVCRALEAAHRLDLVHRDIKPANIFLAREEEGEVVKVLDFGIAKVPKALAASRMALTRTGALLGTPHYISPEQVQAPKSVDFRSDLWSTAVVAFECLTGKRPFVGPVMARIIENIVKAPVPTLAETAPDAEIPASLDEWLQKALSRDPAARFASASELAAAFVTAASAPPPPPAISVPPAPPAEPPFAGPEDSPSPNHEPNSFELAPTGIFDTEDMTVELTPPFVGSHPSTAKSPWETPPAPRPPEPSTPPDVPPAPIVPVAPEPPIPNRLRQIALLVITAILAALCLAAIWLGWLG